MEISVLMENTAKDGFLSEHGLSLYIVTQKHRILFDMGQSDGFIKNAATLGIDLKEVDIAVLSHGHDDHGGGLSAFLSLNQTAKVYVSEHAFFDYFSSDGRYLGLEKELKTHPRIIKTGDETRIDEELSLFTGNKKERPYFMDSFGLSQRKDGQFFPDLFLHEQYLLITEQDQTVLVTGCSHKGILNMLDWTKELPVSACIGGFHYMKIDTETDHEYLNRSANELKQYPITFYTCHCTGMSQYHSLKNELGGQIEYISAGTQFTI